MAPDRMTEFNPLSGAILGSTQVQRSIEADKQRQLHRAQAFQKNVATHDDQNEHEVESSEALHAIDDGNQQHPEQQKRDRRRPDGRKEDGKPHIDLKA
jgi:hypothetical protein